MLALSHPSVWPSVLLNDVGTPISIISQLNGRPACTPVKQIFEAFLALLMRAA